MGKILLSNDLKLNDATLQKFAHEIAGDILVDLTQTIQDSISNEKPTFKYSPISKLILERYNKQVKQSRGLIINNLTSEPLIKERQSELVRGTLLNKKKNAYLDDLSKKHIYSFAQESVTDLNFVRLANSIFELGINSSKPAPNPFLFLNLHLWQVYCVDETGKGRLGEAGKDEIAFGGTAINEVADHAVIKEFDVKSFSDSDGPAKRTKTYGGIGQIVHTYPLVNRNLTSYPFPYVYHTYFTIAEKDCGGFAKFLEDLWKQIAGYVIASMAAIGAAVGAGIGSLGGPIGTVVGAVVGVIIGFLISVIANAFKDDIFQPQIIAVSLPSFVDNFDGSDSGPFQSFTFKQHHGEYQLTLCWSLSR